MWRTPFTSPFCKGFHTPSPMRCSTPLIDSQSPSLLVSSSGSRPQHERTFIPCSVPNLREDFSSCRFHPIMNGFSTNAPSIRSCYMKHDLSCFDPHSNWDIIGVLDCSSFLFFCGLYQLIIWCSRSPLYCLYLKTKPSAMCVTDVTRMRSCMSYRKLLNYKDICQHLGATQRANQARAWHLKLPIMFSYYYGMRKEMKFHPFVWLLYHSKRIS